MTGAFEVRVRAFRARGSSSRFVLAANGKYAMPKKKLSDQALAALIENLIDKEPHEFDGYLWAARPQSHYFETLGVAQVPSCYAPGCCHFTCRFSAESEADPGRANLPDAVVTPDWQAIRASVEQGRCGSWRRFCRRC